MRRGPRWLVGAVLAGSLAARVAYGDGSGDEKAAAQALFDRAQALVEQDHFVEACPQFAESERLDPAIGTMLWLADCYENAGQTANAWTTFDQAAVMSAARHDPREAVARARAARLAARISRLTIVVPPKVAEAPGLQIRCDGVAIDSALFGQPLSLDPGSHTITGNAENRQVWWTTVQLAPGDGTTSVTVPELAAVPSAPTPVAGSASVPRAEGVATPRASRGTAQRIAGIALAAGGATGVLVGSVLSLNAKARYDDSRAFCLADNECAAIGRQDRLQASSMAAGATVAFGVGAAAIAGGIVLFLTAPRSTPIALALSPGFHGGALHASWTW